MSDSNRQKLVDKIKALLSKTTENGCTDAEHMAALSKARALMDAYQVTEEEVEQTKKETAEISAQDFHDPNHIARFITPAVATFSGCKAWKQDGRSRYYTTINFAGLPVDTDLAHWLLSHLITHVQRELTLYCMKTVFIDRNDKNHCVNGFVLGACSRICERLKELSTVVKTSTGNALVVVKNQLITEAMAKAGIKTSAGRSTKRIITKGSQEAGRAAGDRASFSRPVNSGSSTILLGRK